jgi:RHS repeat-associated protein
VNPTYNANNQIATWGANTYAMDANGNTLSGDGTKTYKWDAENRLIEIDYVGGSNKTVFTYDAFSRRITTAETVSGTTTPTRNLWCGSRICQTRTSADAVIARYHPEGEYILTGTKKYVYMPDQLGSVRDVIDATTGTAAAALDYSPYGKPVRTWGTVTPLYQYAGLAYHANSGLMLATYRALDGATGRWLNRDPIREHGGINLYGYVGGNPTNAVDTMGLMKLPGNPGGLPPNWVADPTHKDPNGERWRGPNGEYLDFHSGRPGLPGWRGVDHWHHNGGEEHLLPGDEISDPDNTDKDGEKKPDTDETKNGETAAKIVAGSAGLYIAYRCVRMLPSLLPPLWPTIPINGALP